LVIVIGAGRGADGAGVARAGARAVVWVGVAPPTTGAALGPRRGLERGGGAAPAGVDATVAGTGAVLAVTGTAEVPGTGSVGAGETGADAGAATRTGGFVSSAR
jgi:hypothetical protein